MSGKWKRTLADICFYIYISVDPERKGHEDVDTYEAQEDRHVTVS